MSETPDPARLTNVTLADWIATLANAGGNLNSPGHIEATRLLADLQAENARLTAALRGLVAGVDAATEPYDDCHDCAAVNDWDDRENDSCALHSNMTLWQAYREALEALGPCWCGHTLSQHHDEDSTSCKACVDCSAFKHPDALTPKGETP
ncbi:MAG TPA: hypothetical protein DCQ04_13305 [Actinobacteria bacterium]|nr:hypothetical protein [Actinomycetota bacterium]